MEIMMRRRPQAIDAVAEIDARQVSRENLLLGKPGLQPEGDDHLLRLALDRSITGQKTGLCELLGDRAPALPDAPTPHVGEQCAPNSSRVDAPVPIEAAVLDRYESRRSEGIKPRDVHRR